MKALMRNDCRQDEFEGIEESIPRKNNKNQSKPGQDPSLSFEYYISNCILNNQAMLSWSFCNSGKSNFYWLCLKGNLEGQISLF